MNDAVCSARSDTSGRKQRGLPLLGQSPTARSFCHACWTGEYPVEFTPPARQRQMRLLDT